MVYSKLCRLLAGLMFLFAPDVSSAALNRANPPDNISLTHHKLAVASLPLPATSFSSESEFKTARVYWLPDFLKNNLGRVNDKSQSPGGGGGDGDYACENYGYETPGKRNMQIYECKLTYSAGNKCYHDCKCKDDFKFTDSNCPSRQGKVPSGAACEGKYDNCSCRPPVNINTNTEDCTISCGGNCVEKKCKPTVIVDPATEVCNHSCGGNCVNKSCKTDVRVGAGEKCTAHCASNTSVCTAKSCNTAVSVGSGEHCTERCASDNSVCTAKSCMAAVTVGVGEKCDLSCGGNCVRKSCKTGVSVSTGEQCNEHCASNSSICTSKSCKPADNPGTGEECKERCASNSSICTRSGCKGSVSVPYGYSCTEYCGSSCVRKGCTSTSGYQYCSCGGYGGSVYSCGTTYYRYCSPCCSDVCSRGSKYISCNSSQNKVKVATTGCGSSCYECQAKCSDSCITGNKSVSCGTGYFKVRVGSTGCGSACYACKGSDECKTGNHKSGTVSRVGWCDCQGSCATDATKYIWCGDHYYCTTYGGEEKFIYTNYHQVDGPFKGSASVTQINCENKRATKAYWCTD